MKRSLSTLACIAVCTAATTASAQLSNPLVRNVNCNNGGVIQSRIDTATLARPLVIRVNGTCTENITIKRDHVTIESKTPGSRTVTIEGEITISGAQNVQLIDMNVRRAAGPATNGIIVQNGASASIQNVNVSGHRLRQLRLRRSASVVVDRSQFIGNANSQETVALTDGNSMLLQRSLIRAVKVNDFDGHGLGLYRNAVAFLSTNARVEHTGTGCDPNNDFECAATIVGDGSQLRLHDDGPANTVSGNAVAFDRGQIDARATTFTGNLNANTMSYIEMRDTTTVNGNVTAGRRSLIRYKGASQTGTLNCFGESAVNGVPAGVAVPGSCTVL